MDKENYNSEPKKPNNGKNEPTEDNIEDSKKALGRKKDSATQQAKRLAFYELLVSRWKRDDIIKTLGISARTYTRYMAYARELSKYYDNNGVKGKSWDKGLDFTGNQIEADVIKRMLEAPIESSGIQEEERVDLIVRLGSLEKLSAVTEKEVYKTFDSGIYANVVKGYLKKTLDDIKSAGSTEKSAAVVLIEQELLDNISNLMGSVGSQYAERYYKKGGNNDRLQETET